MNLTNMISMLTARMHAVRSRLPGQSGTTAELLSAAVNSLESGIRSARAAIDDPVNARDAQRGAAGIKLAEATNVLMLGQAGIITLTRQAAPPAEAPPASPPVGGGGGGRGGPPDVPPPPGAPTVWSQLFPEGPWYSQPGYLIGGAVLLGGAAVALSIMSKKRASKPATQEA